VFSGGDAVQPAPLLFLVGAESLSDDQRTRMFLSMYLGIAAMVYAVVAGRVEEPLQRPRLAQRLGVDPEW
jgi:hypothetical protein